MPKNIGYLLPAGDAYTDDFVCAIVAVPNKPEYFNALRGTLDYLGMWLAWERDEDKRGKDAARAWLEANEITQECWAMATCDQILALLISIDSKLGNIGCCDGATTIGDVITVTTTIVPGVGPDPTVWGETSVSDWDEWLEYVCYHAHKFVDRLVETAGTLDTIMELGAYTIEFFANILRALRFLTLVYPVSYDSAVQIFQSFKDAGDASDTFDGVGAKFEAAREDIVCAFIQGSSVEDAVEAALDDNTLWTILYQFNNYDSLQALVYEGTVDGSVYLAPVKRDDCTDCGQIGEYLSHYEFPADFENWQLGAGGPQWISGQGNPLPCVRIPYTGIKIYQTTNTLMAYQGLTPQVGDTVDIHKITLDYKGTSGWPQDLILYLNHDGGTWSDTINADSTSWDTYEKVFSPPLTSTSFLSDIIRLTSNDGAGGYIYLDNIIVDFDSDAT